MVKTVDGEYIPHKTKGALPAQHKRKIITDLMTRIHKSDILVCGEDSTRLYKAINKVFDKAAEGSLPHLEFIVDRIEGKPVQSVGIGQAEDLTPIGNSLLSESFDVLLAKVQAVKQLANKEDSNE